MTRSLVGARFKLLREELRLSQEAIGAQGFVSVAGWIKLEVGQRQPSEKLLSKLCDWLVKDRYITPVRAPFLLKELLTLKHLGGNSTYVRQLAQEEAARSPVLNKLVEDLKILAAAPAKRGRPSRRLVPV